MGVLAISRRASMKLILMQKLIGPVAAMRGEIWLREKWSEGG